MLSRYLIYYCLNQEQRMVASPLFYEKQFQIPIPYYCFHLIDNPLSWVIKFYSSCIQNEVTIV